MHVLHIGLGPLGRKIASDLYTRGFGKIAAAIDVDPQIAGQPLRDIVPESGNSGPVLASLDQVKDWSAIDAAVVASYSLPVRIERELLRFFEGARRPVAHSWSGWANMEDSTGLSLAEILSGARDRFTGNWDKKTFTPLPIIEADALRRYLL